MEMSGYIHVVSCKTQNIICFKRLVFNSNLSMQYLLPYKLNEYECQKQHLCRSIKILTKLNQLT